MENHTDNFTDHLVEAFSWMLIHSLWQGIVLAMLTALLLMMTRNLSSAVRYRLVLFNFALFVLCTAGTFLWYWTGGTNLSAFPGRPVPGGGMRLYASSISDLSANFSRHARFVVLVWLVVFAFRSVKMLRDLVYINKLRYSDTRQVTARWEKKVMELSIKLGLTVKVRLLESGIVNVPVVLGHFKPIILIPAGLLTGLPVVQLEAVLLHELAHIRRHDFLVNLLQTLTETVFFFNPGLVWISGLLKEEREHCCDELALAQTGNRKALAQALVSFKEYALSGADHRVAFAGKKNKLMGRVSRIMGAERDRAPAGTSLFIGVTGLLLLCVLGTTLSIAQISPFGIKPDPTPERVTRLFEPERSGPAENRSPSKKAKAAGKIPAVTPIVLPGAESANPSKAAADTARGASRDPGMQGVLDRENAETDRQKTEADRARTEMNRQRVEVILPETIINKSPATPPAGDNKEFIKK